MLVPKSLSGRHLRAIFNPEKLSWQNSNEIPLKLANGRRDPFQARAMQALELADKINEKGYNVYLAGDPSLGRTYLLKSWLSQVESLKKIPDDILYVYNFENPDVPLYLKLPAGEGQRFKNQIEEFIKNIGKNLEKKLDSNSYARKRATLFSTYQGQRSEIIARMMQEAHDNGFRLEIDENLGIALSLEDGDENSLLGDIRFKLEMRKKGESLTKKLAPAVRDLAKMESQFAQSQLELERKGMEDILNALFSPLEKKFAKNFHQEKINRYLASMRKDLVEHVSVFLTGLTHATRENDDPPQEIGINFRRRYEINLFVDNSGLTGAPVIFEDNPSPASLLGCIEREPEMGALLTDFTLIRAGSLQKANGGYLILQMEDLLAHPYAWEGLLRALRTGKTLLEDGNDFPDLPVRAKSIRPEALPVQLKVILVGDDYLYDELLYTDSRFAKIFGIKATMRSEIEKNSVNIRQYLIQLAKIIADSGLLPFDKTALAWLVELGSALCEDQRKLSLQFPVIRDYMIEADALARENMDDMVTAQLLEATQANREFRANLTEEILLDEYNRELIRVNTEGQAIGQVNGLSITTDGMHEFGLPNRISCAVGVGHDGIMDLEREADLGGPIHTKAMMILKSYLTRIFADKKPIVLSASLYFEQNYGEIEGDSASGAELAALISALANIPCRLDLAFTGAVSHTGEIMAVGGVSKKIEGFFKICLARGLTGTQGVIIPLANVEHLALSPQVITSVENRQFGIYPVKTMEEALLLLTGKNVGKKLKKGGFSKDSLFDLVDRRLEALGAYAQNSFKKSRKENN